ncbi:MAG: hypothetical protein LBH17_02275 [Oscillospiraceae bacterium]|nr:hypothetical protein [Oscillospiraceae bacterium]
MFTSEIIKKLKQVNISADAEKSRARIAGLWKNTPKQKRTEILSLAGVSLATVQRAYKTGNISAKLVVPLAQVLNVNPFFLTGETDSVDECNDDLLRELLEQHKYTKLLREYSSTERSRVRREKRETAAREYEVIDPSAPESSDAPVAAEPSIALGEDAADLDALDLANSLSEEDMVLLLKAALLRAKMGGIHADIVRRLRLLLLS